MDTLSGYIATILVSLFSGYLAQFLQPRSRLICWSPHNFFFDLKDESVKLQTNSLTVQNTGRLAAEDVEIIHKQRPDFFELFPSMHYEEVTNPNGEHVIKLKSLGPNEWVVVQLLSYKAPAVFHNVRWKNGQSTWVQIQPQIIAPKWKRGVFYFLTLVGVGTLVYFLLRAGAYAVALIPIAGS